MWTKDQIQIIEEAIANVRLAAAAPELLAACKAGLKEIESVPGAVYDITDRRQKTAIENELKAVIAKAEKGKG